MYRLSDKVQDFYINFDFKWTRNNFNTNWITQVSVRVKTIRNLERKHGAGLSGLCWLIKSTSDKTLIGLLLNLKKIKYEKITHRMGENIFKSYKNLLPSVH